MRLCVKVVWRGRLLTPTMPWETAVLDFQLPLLGVRKCLFVCKAIQPVPFFYRSHGRLIHST